MKKILFPLLLLFFHDAPAQHTFISSTTTDGKNEYVLKVAVDTLSQTCVLDSIFVFPIGYPEKRQSLAEAGYLFADDRSSVAEDSSYLGWGTKYFLQDINMDGHTDVCALHYSYDEEEHLNTFRYYWIYNPRTGRYDRSSIYSSLVDPVTDPGNKCIIDMEFYDDSCAFTRYQLVEDVLVPRATRTLGHADFLRMDSILLILPHNDGLCNDDHRFSTNDHINYSFPYDDADLFDGGFTVIPQFQFDRITVSQNFTLAYGAKTSETEGWSFYDSTFSDSVNKLTCFSYSPTKTLKSDGWFTFSPVSAATSDIATGCPKPKVKFKTADDALRKRNPDFYAFVYDPNDYSNDSPQLKKQEESAHQTHLYYYYENITITVYSNGKKIEKVIHLYIRHGEC